MKKNSPEPKKPKKPIYYKKLNVAFSKELYDQLVIESDKQKRSLTSQILVILESALLNKDVKK